MQFVFIRPLVCKWAALFLLSSINLLLFVLETPFVVWEVETELLNATKMSSHLLSVNEQQIFCISGKAWLQVTEITSSYWLIVFFINARVNTSMNP